MKNKWIFQVSELNVKQEELPACSDLALQNFKSYSSYYSNLN